MFYLKNIYWKTFFFSQKLQSPPNLIWRPLLTIFVCQDEQNISITLFSLFSNGCNIKKREEKNRRGLKVKRI